MKSTRQSDANCERIQLAEIDLRPPLNLDRKSVLALGDEVLARRAALPMLLIGVAALTKTRRSGLEDWPLIVPLLQSWLGQWTDVLSRVPVTIALAAWLLPVTLAIFSRRIGFVIGCAFLAIVALCAFLSPANTTVTLATGAYLGSLAVALLGILLRRKAEAVQAEFARLRSDVDLLMAAEERRFLSELRSLSEESNTRISTIPKGGHPAA